MLGLVVGAAMVAAASLMPSAYAHGHVATLDVRSPEGGTFYMGIDFNEQGQFAVSDWNNDRVHVFHPNGTFAFAVGSHGAGPGEFSNTRNVAFGPDGLMAVADLANHRVQVFHPNGTFAYQFGSHGSTTGHFKSPDAVAWGPLGRIAVADATNRVQIFDSSGRFVNLLLPPGGSTENFASVEKLAFGPDGLLAVTVDIADFRGVQVFHPNGTFAFEVDLGRIVRSVDFGPSGLMVGAFGRSVGIFHPNGTYLLEFSTSSPKDVAFGPLGRLAVADNANIMVFNITSLTDSTPIPETPAPAPAPAAPMAPAPAPAAPMAPMLAPAELPLVHADGVEIGGFLFEFGSYGGCHGVVYEGEFCSLDHVAVGPTGEIVVGDANGIQVFHPDGTFKLRLDLKSPPVWDEMAIGLDGRIIMVSYSGGRQGVDVYHSNGTLDFNIPIDRGIDDVGVGPGGAIAVVTDVVTNRWFTIVYVYHPNGTLDFTLGGREGSIGELSGARSVDIAPDGAVAVSGSHFGSQDGHIVAAYPNGTDAFTFRMHHSQVVDFSFGPNGELVDMFGDIYYPNGTYAGHVHRNDGFDLYRSGDYDIGPTGKVVHADHTRHRIVVFNGIEPTDDLPPPVAELPAPAMPPLAMSLAGAAYAFEFGSLGSGAGQFMAARDIAFGPGGIIAVADTGSHRVQVFHPNGTYAYALGALGEGPGEFYYPEGLAFGPGGLLAVSDMGNSRVQVFRLQ